MRLPEFRFEKINIEPNKRILVTSDIHGNLAYFKQVLEKSGFCSEDQLIIVGDMIDKGPKSLETLRYIMQLYARGNVIALIGNVDASRLQWLYWLSEKDVDWLFRYMNRQRSWYGTCLFDEMLGELGHRYEAPNDILKWKDEIISHFAPELDFLSGLPTIVETQNYVFVHGGLRDQALADNCRRELFELVKFDDFMSTAPCFDKYVVVGHWPVSLYNTEICQLNPIINQEKRIISIDGGCGTKEIGQLNLLMIPSMDCAIEDITYISYDALPTLRATTPQTESQQSFYIRWTDNAIRIIEKGEEYTYVEHVSSGRRLWMYNKYINGEEHCIEYTDYVLPVSANDKLSICDKTPKGYLVKKNGVWGWYYGICESSSQLDSSL